MKPVDQNQHEQQRNAQPQHVQRIAKRSVASRVK